MPERIDSDTPAHVAIIMDGNGRWAAQRGLPRSAGHRRGVETVRHITREARQLDIHYLTLFSFSSENWQRPQHEVHFLLQLLERFIEADLAELHTQDVRLRVLGRRAELSPKLRRLIDHAENLTAENTSQQLQIAFNYGGREEIADAAARLAVRAAAGTLDPKAITPAVFAAELLTAGVPEPDLLIRTGGEYRISNFLLWQCAYTEFYFSDTLWPNFTRADLDEALAVYAKRERRFGRVNTQEGGGA